MTDVHEAQRGGDEVGRGGQRQGRMRLIAWPGRPERSVTALALSVYSCTRVFRDNLILQNTGMITGADCPLRVDPEALLV